MPVVGETAVFRRDGPRTPIVFCSRCDVYGADLPPGTHTDASYTAGYTRRSQERTWRKRRDGFNRYLLRLIEESAPAGWDAPVLVDFGSCYGHFLATASRRGYRVVGVEANPELVYLTNRRGFQVVSTLDDVEPGVDVITFIDSFYYVERPYETLCVARSRLRDGGILLLRVTNRNWLAALRRRFVSNDLGLLGDALFSYSPAALGKLLEKAGFRPCRIIADRGVGKALGWFKKAAYSFLQLPTALSAGRINLTPGVIIIAGCAVTETAPVLAGLPSSAAETAGKCS